jgi:hypothetical protein
MGKVITEPASDHTTIEGKRTPRRLLCKPCNGTRVGAVEKYLETAMLYAAEFDPVGVRKRLEALLERLP